MLHSRWSTFAMIFLWTRVCQRLETEYVATALVVTRSAGTGGTHSRRLALDGAARKLSDSLPWTSSPRPTPTVLHAAPVKITPRTRSNFHRTPRRVSTRRHSLPLSPFASSGSSSIYTQLFSSQKPMSSLSTASTSSTTTFTDTELTEVKRDFQSATELYRKNLASTTKLPALQSRIADLETEQSQPDFWDEPNTSRAAIVNAQVSTATRLLTRIQAWQEWHGDAQAALEILSQSWTASSDDATAVTSGLNNSLRLASEERAMLLDEFRSAIARLREDSERFELELLLSGPYDHAPARLLLTAGAGGTEANDWVGDLKRMYQRHCEAMGLSCVVQDEQAGEAVGYKSVELLVSGENAYGWLQGEKGAHRMVRLSPFNANNKRQTTFAGVDVAPDILNQDDDAYWNTIDVPESELEITTMRAGGKGGQNVNKVNSAVRIKHLPSGLQVKCAQERSQSMNKNIALKRLKAQLLAIVQEQRVAEIKEIRGDMVEASWGAQIRNYVFHPYKMIKDQRTGWETSNVQAFMDGDLLEECIGSFLRHKAEEQRKEQIANELSRVKDYMFLVEKTKRERQEKAVQQKLDAKLEHERQQQEVEDRQRRAEEKVTREQQRNTYGKRDRVCEKMASASFESLESEQKSSIVWADTFDVNLDVEVLCTNLDLTGLQSLAQELENITCPKESLTMIHQEVLVAKQRETDGDFSNGEQSNDKSPTVTPALKLNLWTKEELSALAKTVKKYPPGGSSRWEQIALFVNNLCKQDELRSTEECIEKYNNMAKTHSKATESTNGVAAASEPENSSQSNEDVWTAEQDQQLQDGHAANPASMGKKSGGPQLQSVSGKSKKQCAQRFKVIRDSFTTVNG